MIPVVAKRPKKPVWPQHPLKHPRLPGAQPAKRGPLIHPALDPDTGKLRQPTPPRAGFGFSPWVMPDAPAGTYDPSLDAAVRATQRGLADTRQDVERADLRDSVDYGLARENIQRQGFQGLENIGAARADEERGFGRGLSDLLTARTRGTEDYGSAVEGLSRSFERLAVSQRQQQAQAGVLRGTTALKAAQIRAKNTAIAQEPLDTSYRRGMADSSLAEGRMREDHTLAGKRLDQTTDRLVEDTSLQLGRLAIDAAPPDAGNPFGGRSFQDRSTTLTRAEREAGQFGIDVAAQKGAQAGAAGWDPYAGRPKNEFTGPQGPYRVVMKNGFRYEVAPSGKVLSKTRRKK